MKKLSLITFSYFISGQIYSQYEFTSDKDYSPIYISMLEKLKLQTFDNKNIFELRIWISEFMSSPDLLRLVLTQDSTWIAIKYDSEYKSNFIRRYI